MVEESVEQTVTFDGVQLRVSNLAKVLYPQTGTTKADVLRYYATIARFMVPHCADRPITRKRWPHGVDGAMFFQKNLGAGTPHWIQRAAITHSSAEHSYPIANDRPTLAWLAQMAALELHVPQWRFDSAFHPLHPDRIVFDLDPGEAVSLPQVAHVGLLIRQIVEAMGLACYPVTSGSKGMHIYAGLDGTYSSEQTSALAKELARSLEADHPDLVVSQMSKAARSGKVLLDWSQNKASKTTICPYSLRGTGRPYVAAPRTWEELADPQLRQLQLDEVLTLVTGRGDPMAALGRSPGAGAARDRLEIYRSKREATRTPEPIPDRHGPDDPSERTFVIQEHHASRLHWDLRLSRHGVLVSWALPKGIPTDPSSNHLAVQTEDHPLEYARFSGTIPDGEYGAGHMSIWDHGTYVATKWRPGKEVIVILTGQPGGGLDRGPGQRTQIALINTGDNWLIHRMAARGGSRGGGPAPSSVSAGPGLPASPGTPAPMLATATTRIPAEPGWQFEMKWDGIRTLAHIEGDRVRLFSRSGKEQTSQFPELAVLGELVAADHAIIDGEIVMLDDQGRPSFALLQPRINASNELEVARIADRRPVQLMAFDVLALEQTSLVSDPYHHRRDALQALLAEHPLVHVPPASDDGAATLRTSRELGLEGVIAKRIDSRYRPGHRSQDWLKLVHTRTQEVVVVGWRSGKGRYQDAVGSLLLALPGHHGLRYIGRVGSGFTDRERVQWLTRFAPLTQSSGAAQDVPDSDAVGTTWLQPTLVAEVEFAGWTSTRRLRHPRWRGWRPDKSATDVPSSAAGLG
ncbi:MAG: ATP-dependent DNA ligase [Beutenbergiaceae bacterium]